VIATSHGEGGGAGGAGGALVAMSAAIAEVVANAIRTNDKATFFITEPLVLSLLRTQPISPIDIQYRAKFPRRQTPNLRNLNRHEFFNFVIREPRLKRRQMLPFYAFAG
jgi:hypothetical protein